MLYTYTYETLKISHQPGIMTCKFISAPTSTAAWKVAGITYEKLSYKWKNKIQKLEQKFGVKLYANVFDA